MRAVESVRSFAEEVMVVLTQPAPEAEEKLRYQGITVHYSLLGNCFSAPLNFGLDRCRTRWCFRLDDDETVSPELAAEIRKVVTGGEDAIYWVPRIEFPEDRPFATWQARLWRVSAELRFVGRVHEQLGRGEIRLDDLLGAPRMASPIVHHTTRQMHEGKEGRYARLAALDRALVNTLDREAVYLKSMYFAGDPLIGHRLAAVVPALERLDPAVEPRYASWLRWLVAFESECTGLSIERVIDILEGRQVVTHSAGLHLAELLARVGLKELAEAWLTRVLPMGPGEVAFHDPVWADEFQGMIRSANPVSCERTGIYRLSRYAEEQLAIFEPQRCVWRSS